MFVLLKQGSSLCVWHAAVAPFYCMWTWLPGLWQYVRATALSFEWGTRLFSLQHRHTATVEPHRKYHRLCRLGSRGLFCFVSDRRVALIEPFRLHQSVNSILEAPHTKNGRDQSIPHPFSFNNSRWLQGQSDVCLTYCLMYCLMCLCAFSSMCQNASRPRF